jgi:hypothetical protein
LIRGDWSLPLRPRHRRGELNVALRALDGRTIQMRGQAELKAAGRAMDQVVGHSKPRVANLVNKKPGVENRE